MLNYHSGDGKKHIFISKYLVQDDHRPGVYPHILLQFQSAQLSHYFLLIYLFVVQLKVTPILWPLKGMMWTTIEELHSKNYRVIIQLCMFLCIRINNVHLLRSKLTNDDFRKLLMTPRAAPSSAPPSKSRHHE